MTSVGDNGTLTRAAWLDECVWANGACVRGNDEDRRL